MLSTMRLPYSLPPHVHACRRGSNVILLDLRRDRYVGVNDAQYASCAERVAGWPSHEATDICAPENECEQFLQKLQSEGMLVRGVAVGSNRAPAQTRLPEHALIEGYDQARSTVRWTHVVHTLRAALIAKALLRWRSLEQLAIRFRKRRALTQHVPFDLDLARGQVAAFNRLQPIIFTAADACLYHSLATAEFLAAQNLFPDWVFGVRTDPFGAHCWLQRDDVVVNDTPENVGVYTPILVL